MDKITYIKHYKKLYSRVIDSVKKDYNIDDTYIYHNSLGKLKKYEIDKIVNLLNFFNSFKVYIYGLKKDDKILIEKYGNRDYGIIKKISYKRKLSKTGKKIISSMVIKNIIKDSDYEAKINIKDIVYQDIEFENILNLAKMFYSYHFFSEYDIEKADKIIKKLKGV